MAAATLIHDLYVYNDWANAKMLAMAGKIDERRLDEPQPMGFGSLRATFHHMAFAERLWLDRWLGKPWQPLATDAGRISLSELSELFAAISRERSQLIDAEAATNFDRMVAYRNTAGEPFNHRLGELMVHVANHGIHHRAQALNFLRVAGQTTPGGLDYLFYKLAKPTTASEEGVRQKLRAKGLEMGSELTPAPLFSATLVQRYCQYGCWATESVVQSATTLSNAELDQPFDMGPGTLRKTLLHVADAERWWWRNWTAGPGDFDRLPETTSMEEFATIWRETCTQRDRWLSQKSAEALSSEVSANIAGGQLNFRLGESVIQLCGHGTHHRAQAVNMLRRLGQKPPALDYVVWLRGPGAIPPS